MKDFKVKQQSKIKCPHCGKKIDWIKSKYHKCLPILPNTKESAHVKRMS
jgi:DNA-directed RNA polymerase subunit RPC12/RpoP